MKTMPPSVDLRSRPTAPLRRRFLSALLLPLLAAVFPIVSAPAQTTSAVPPYFNFQGKVVNANGTPIGAAASGGAVNRQVIFRIWDHTSNAAAANLIYSEKQMVTITEGEFSVLLGLGDAVTTSPLGFSESGKGPGSGGRSIDNLVVFGAATRFLGITVDDGDANTADPEITPRQQLVTSAYAFRAKYAESLGSNGVSTLTTLDNGNVGIGSASPGTKLEVAGNIRAGGAGTPNPSLQLLANSASTVASSITFANSSGQFSTDAAAGDTVVRTDNGGKLLLQTGTGVSALTINSSNNIGIGTAAPGAKLEVVTTDNVNTAYIHNTGGGGGTQPALRVRTDASSGNRNVIQAENLDGTVFAVRDSGGVTIGPATSTSRLNVGGSDSTGSGNGAGIAISNSATGGGTWFLRPGATGTATPAGGFSIGDLQDYRLAINSSGNVGIGTTSPSAKLEVNGGIRASSVTSGGYTFASPGDTDGGLFSPADGMVTINTNGSEKLRVDNGGNVGIGTSTPGGRLHVATTGAIAGVALSNTALGGSTWYLQVGATGTVTPAASFSIGDPTDYRLVINNAGNVGIGTLNPSRGKLEVVGSVSRGSLTNYRYYNGSGATGLATATPLFGIWSDNVIGTGAEFVIYSDERIKIPEGRSDGEKDLRTLMQIEVTDYRYKDKVAKGDRPQKKLLGQQVERVFPQAITRTTEVVPDIFQVAKLKEGWIELATDLKKGDRIKLVTDDGEKMCDVSSVESGRFQVNVTPTGEEVFVYGREVHDFRAVDYDAIAMLNVSATQAIKREHDAEVLALRTANLELTQRVAELEAQGRAREAALAAKDLARDAKIAAIEKLLQSSQTVMARPAATPRAGANGQE